MSIVAGVQRYDPLVFIALKKCCHCEEAVRRGNPPDLQETQKNGGTVYRSTLKSWGIATTSLRTGLAMTVLFQCGKHQFVVLLSKSDKHIFINQRIQDLSLLPIPCKSDFEICDPYFPPDERLHPVISKKRIVFPIQSQLWLQSTCLACGF